jgi:hypothetical protein
MARRLSPAAQARLHHLRKKEGRDVPQANAEIVAATGVEASAPASDDLR